MGAAELTESEVRAQAVARGLDPDEAVSEGLRGAWVHALWNHLLMILEINDAESMARIRGAKLRFQPFLKFQAKTAQWKGNYTVRVDLGVVEAISESARILTSLSSDDSFHSPPEGLNPLEVAGVRLAHTLGFLTSAAGQVVPTPSHGLTPKGENFALGMTAAATLFVLAHEAAHILADDDGPDAHPAEATERERRADEVAVLILRMVAEAASHDWSDIVPAKVNPFPLHLTIPAAAMFLEFEGLHRRAVAAAAYRLTDEPMPMDVFAATTAASHPSPYERLARLEKLIDLASLGDDAREGVVAIRAAFEPLPRYVERNMPEWALDADELEAWAHANDSPVIFGEGASITFEQVYSMAVIDCLRSCIKAGAVGSDDVDAVRELTMRMPRTVINTIVDLQIERYELEDDERAMLSHVASAVVRQMTPSILRFAFQASPQDVARRLPLPK